MKQTFSVNAVFKEAYAIMKPKFWSVIGQFLLIYVGLSVLFFILLGRGAALGGIITSFVLLRWSLSYVHKGSFSFDDIFENLTFKRFIYFILTVILVVLAIVGGMILLIIPGIIFAVWVTFAKYLVIEMDLKPMEALRESKRITKGVRWKIFWFYIVSGFVLFLGFLCLIVGIFFAAPLVFIAGTVLYKKLSNQASVADDGEIEEVVIETV